MEGVVSDANFTIGSTSWTKPLNFSRARFRTPVFTTWTTLAEDTNLTGDLSNHARDPETGTAGLVFQTNFVDYNGTNDANGSVALNPFTGAFVLLPDPITQE